MMRYPEEAISSWAPVIEPMLKHMQGRWLDMCNKGLKDNFTHFIKMYDWDLIEKDANVFLRPLPSMTSDTGYLSRKTLKVKYVVSRADCDLDRTRIGLGVAFVYNDLLHQRGYTCNEEICRSSADVIMMTPKGLVMSNREGDVIM